ncbi:nuclease-related domain-containing protein [Virgibacillus kekensis]|uniref:Nuclease-related domain-containing protein n=1 Tax=Virgibacillus kekensis TaxID=202261 RepID=A0ABV9DI42_9BACI
MIIKPHSRQIYHQSLEALDRRTPDFHHLKEAVRKELINTNTGIKGEREISYPLSFLPPTDYRILHNLRLPSHDSHFETDSLLMNQQFFTQIEVKNWYGTVYFDGEEQVIRVGDDGKEEGFPSPILQVKLQRDRFRLLLNNLGLPRIPLLYFVVFSFPSTILKPLYPEKPIPKEVIHANALFHKMKQLSREFKTPVIDRPTLDLVSQQLLQAHVPPDKNVMKRFGVNYSDLTRGVICINCGVAPMVRFHQKWYCGRCNHYSPDAHIAALNDYYLLVNDTISNQQAREFLAVDSHHLVRRLLANAGYKFIGYNKARVYKLELL